MKTTYGLWVSAAIALAAPSLSAATPTVKDELTFTVSLDDQPIGVHRFEIADQGAMRVVASEATFDFRILRVPVYRYRHRNTETWQNGCLQRISAETDANGTPYAVDLSKTAAGYRIVTPSEAQTHAVDCMMSFAYWDQRFLQQKRLLNTQTGEWIPVEVQSLGESQRQIADQMLSVRGFRILAESKGVDIKVFYRPADGRWVALESALENGRTLRYALAADHRLVGAERVADPPSTRR